MKSSKVKAVNLGSLLDDAKDTCINSSHGYKSNSCMRNAINEKCTPSCDSGTSVVKQ